MKKLIAAVLAALALGACNLSAPKDPTAQSDNSEASFKGSPKIPVDRNLYVITGQVIGDPSSLTRQVDPGGGSVYGYGGYISGRIVGPEYAGKGFVRIKVSAMKPVAPFAGVEDVVIIKTSDTKAAALIPGDVVQFKCRAQYESVAPIQVREHFERDAYATWEFDFCRLTSPDIGGK